MTYRKFFAGALASLMVVTQLSWVSVAAAEDPGATPAPTPEASASPAPSSSPEPSVSPEPTPAPSSSPEPTAAPSPSPEASASPAPGGAASPSPSPAPKKKSTDVGPDGCGGVVPDWVFDTTTRKWVAANKGSFSCDKASGYYLSPLYFFDKRIGWYEILSPAAAAAKPDYMITAPGVVHTVLGDMVVGSQDYQVAKAMGLLTDGAGGILVPAASASGTGAGSNNQAGVTGGGQSWFDLTNLVNVVNTLQSSAVSGNVGAENNTTVGNASTGAAMVVANLINLLASAWSWSSGNLSFFMQTLLAPHDGDIQLNPTQTTTGGGGQLGGATSNVGIDGTGAGSNNTADINNPNSLNVNVQNTGNITNNVNLNAQSGDANLSGNTSTGNVSTGNAMAQVNIINLINSFISSGSSFFGILNIIGNLNGDILFPDNFLNGIVPAGSQPAGGTAAGISGTGAGSNNTVGVDNSGNTTINNQSANTVNNNILTTAGSGAANLNANTSVGDVQTGSATTTSSLYNLANSSIFGDNAVLVMVNVMGHWVGKIMNLPGTGGTQAALLTGNANVGINNTGADSNNGVNVNNGGDTTVNQNSTGTITNNVNVNAQSGDANVSKNTKVGDVTTGNATASSSAANFFNTMLNVKHWFGVLVINVFGDWTGSVNEDTAAGGFSTRAAAGGQRAAGGAAEAATAGSGGSLPSVGLLALAKPLLASSGGGTADSQPGSGANVTSGGKVLTAAAKTTPADTLAATKAKNLNFLFILSALTMLVAGALATIDRKLGRQR